MDSRGNVIKEQPKTPAEPFAIGRRRPRMRPMSQAGSGTISVSAEAMAALVLLPKQARRVFYGARRRDPENVALAKAKTAAANGARSKRR